MRRSLFALALCLTVFSSGCGMRETKLSAERASGQFRVEYEQRKYAQIWAATSPEFRKETTEAEFTKLLEKVHEKLGSTVDVNEGPFNVNYVPGGPFVTIGYNTKFQKGNAQETFIWRVAGSQGPQLVGYNINSKQLILN